MPRIPDGLVDVLQPPEPVLALVAQAPAETPVAPEPSDEDDWCLRPDGSIDNKAQTNKWAAMVAEELQTDVDPQDAVFCAGIVILAGLHLNYRFGQVAKFTGLPLRFCQRVVQNLTYSHLIFKRTLRGELIEELDKPDGGDGALCRLAFTLYCMAGAGTAKHDKGLWSLVCGPDVPFYESQSYLSAGYNLG